MSFQRKRKSLSGIEILSRDDGIGDEAQPEISEPKASPNNIGKRKVSLPSAPTAINRKASLSVSASNNTKKRNSISFQTKVTRRASISTNRRNSIRRGSLIASKPENPSRRGSFITRSKSSLRRASFAVPTPPPGDVKAKTRARRNSFFIENGMATAKNPKAVGKRRNSMELDVDLNSILPSSNVTTGRRNGKSAKLQRKVTVVDRKSKLLLKSLTRSNGLDFLKATSKKDNTIVVSKFESEVKSEEAINASNSELLKFVAKNLSKKQERRNSIKLVGTAAPLQGISEGEAFEDASPSVDGNGPGKSKMAEVKKRMVRKLKMVGKMALVMRISREQSEEKLRLETIQSRWDKVRNIARAAVAVSHMNSNKDHAQHAWLRDYKSFRSILQKDPRDRSSFDIDQLVKSVMSLSFFKESKLSQRQIQELCKSMTMVILPTKHTTLFRQGDVGDFFYVVLVGNLIVKVRSVGGIGSTNVAELGPGDGFGGLSLRSRPAGRRKATILTTNRSELIRIHASDYRRIIVETEELRLSGAVGLLQSVPVLSHLSYTEQKNLALLFKFTTRTYPIGSVICAQGNIIHSVEYLGIISHGKCSVVKRMYKDGSELTHTDLAKVHKDEMRHYKDMKSRDLKRKKQNGKLRVSDELINLEHNNIATVRLKKLSPKEIIGDGKMFGPTGNHRYNVSVYADTVVQVVYIARHGLHQMLSESSISKLQEKIVQYPTGDELWDIYREQQQWERYKKNVVKMYLKETEKGERILKHMEEHKRQEEARKARKSMRENLRKVKEAIDGTVQVAPVDNLFVLIKPQVRGFHAAPMSHRPALLSIDDLAQHNKVEKDIPIID